MRTKRENAQLMIDKWDSLYDGVPICRGLTVTCGKCCLCGSGDCVKERAMPRLKRAAKAEASVPKKAMTDDEIMAAALLCPESEKVPLEVGDRVIALEDFTFFCERIRKGQRGTIVELNRGDYCPWRIRWDGVDGVYWGWHSYPIGKLVKRGSV